MGALQPDTNQKWDPGGAVCVVCVRNNKMCKIAASAETADSTNDPMVDVHEDSRTDVDTHANMPVIG